MRYLFVLLLAGCASRLVAIDYSTAPPRDWPYLEEKIVQIEPADMPKFCRGLGEAVTRSVSCAVTSFRSGVCYIYLTTEDPAVLEHERAHCKGYGHVGAAKAPAEAWERFKARK